MAELLGPGDSDRAAEMLSAGLLVAFPTETVYGLGADASNAAAVAKIFEAKGRPTGHPLIVHVASPGDVTRFVADPGPRASADLDRLAAAFWPGPLTVVLPRSDAIASATTGGLDSVGIRVPDHPVAASLLRAFGGAVAAPSANRFGSVSPTTAAHVMDELGPRIDAVIDGGPSRVGVESTIIDLTGSEPTLLRPGGISQVELEAVLDRPVVDGTGGPSRASGMLASHYAPSATVELVLGGPSELDARLAATKDGTADQSGQSDQSRQSDRPDQLDRVGVIAPWAVGHHPSWVVPPDPAGFASVLYAMLRAADHAGVRHLLIAPPDDGPLHAAVMDRLRKAAAPRPSTTTA
jgi:L-threonylcarbamoyladenylate synthase